VTGLMHTLGLCIHNVIMYDFCTHVVVHMRNGLIPIITNYTYTKADNGLLINSLVLVAFLMVI